LPKALLFVTHFLAICDFRWLIDLSKTELKKKKKVYFEIKSARNQKKPKIWFIYPLTEPK
jgi:hypothetical protein